MNTWISIDGSQGEGGGQILRSSLALSMVTGQAFRIENIRARRSKPGLMRQHLTAVRAAAQVCDAALAGDDIGSPAVTFSPKSIKAGEYHFNIGTAGSTTLVLQTVLPALVLAGGPSRVRLEGGTHNPFAPPFDFLSKTFLPLLNRMGPSVTATLERPGFYPAGGGAIVVDISPSTKLTPLDLVERGQITRRCATATVANLSPHIAERELEVVRKKLNWDDGWLRVDEVRGAPGPGNLVTLEVESAQVCEVFTGFGERDRSAEQVANQAVQECQHYLTSPAPVGDHLADQLLLPLAIAGGGTYLATRATRHTLTHIDLVQRFLSVDVKVTPRQRDGVLVALRPR